MNIGVIAANGRSGRAFVAAALKAGHRVRAGVRGPAPLLGQHERMEIVPCDATQPDAVSRLVAGQDAVVSLIGHVKGSAPNVQTLAMRCITKAMQDLGVKRLVSLTGTGVRLPGDRLTAADWIMNAAVRLVDPARVQDGQRHVEVLKASGLDWTVNRVLKLQHAPRRPFALTPHGPTKLYVGRDEVAAAILQVLEEQSFVGAMPIISPVSLG